MRIHRFETTGDAYDASQCDETIHDGDVLVVEPEGVVGFLYRAWPVAVTETFGAFHQVAEGSTVADLDDGKYLPSEAACQLELDRQKAAKIFAEARARRAAREATRDPVTGWLPGADK